MSKKTQKLDHVIEDHSNKKRGETTSAGHTEVPGQLWQVLGTKGGMGKSTLARVLIDRIMAQGHTPKIVQVDRSTQLADLYPRMTTVIGLPSAIERRADPLAETRAFDPHETSIDLLANEGGIQVDDVGAGAYSRAYIDYVGKARLDAFLASRNIVVRVFLLLTAEPAAMIQSMDLGEAAAVAQPSAKITLVLNEHFGNFRFYPGSAADRVWRERVLPFAAIRRMITMPGMAAGAWPPFEALGKSFLDIIEADELEVKRWLGTSRAIAATLQGDIADWLSTMWATLDPVLGLDSATTGPSDGDR